MFFWTVDGADFVFLFLISFKKLFFPKFEQLNSGCSLSAGVYGPCTVRPIQFSIFSIINGKSYFVYVKGFCLFLNWQYNVTWTKHRKYASIFLFLLFLTLFKVWKIWFYYPNSFLDIFLIFPFSTKNRKLKQWDNLVALFYFFIFPIFWQKWKNEKMTSLSLLLHHYILRL